MMDQSLYEQWDEVIGQVSRSVSRDFPDVETEDLYQHLWEFILTDGGLIPESANTTSLLYRIANRYSWQLRKEHLNLSPQYAYRTSDVRKILETQFEYVDWDTTFVPDDARSELGCDSVELSAEVSWGLMRLKRRNEEYYDAILRRYGDFIVPHRTSNERRRLDRAIEALCDILNWYERPVSDPVGSRKVINNATANYRIRGQLDD
jgi:hypothetical protein